MSDCDCDPQLDNIPEELRWVVSFWHFFDEDDSLCEAGPHDLGVEASSGSLAYLVMNNFMVFGHSCITMPAEVPGARRPEHPEGGYLIFYGCPVEKENDDLERSFLLVVHQKKRIMGNEFLQMIEDRLTLAELQASL